MDFRTVECTREVPLFADEHGVLNEGVCAGLDAALVQDTFTDEMLLN